MPVKTPNHLAILVRNGLAGAGDREELARQTILLAGKRVAALLHYTREDAEDATMTAAAKAIQNIAKWNPTRGAWSTWVARCARDAARDLVAAKARQALSEAAASEWEEFFK